MTINSEVLPLPTFGHIGMPGAVTARSNTCVPVIGDRKELKYYNRLQFVKLILMWVYLASEDFCKDSSALWWPALAGGTTFF